MRRAMTRSVFMPAAPRDRRSSESLGSLGGLGSSEPALWNDQGVPGEHLDVLVDVPVLDQVGQADLDGFALFANAAHDYGAVAGSVFGQSFDRNHQVEHGHVIAVGD